MVYHGLELFLFVKLLSSLTTGFFKHLLKRGDTTPSITRVNSLIQASISTLQLAELTFCERLFNLT